MKVNKILTAFLAGLLAVGAAGCGDVKESGEAAGDKAVDTSAADTSAAETTTTAKEEAPAETTTAATEEAKDDKELTADEAAKTAGDKVSKLQQAAKGELDGGYKAVMTYNAPTTGELGEKNIKPVTLTMEAKQKDKLTGINYVIGYDGKGLMTINAVYDNDKEVAYCNIPELSDGVITGSVKDIEDMVQNSVPVETGNEQADAALQNGPDLDALASIDTEALGDDILSYVDTFTENFPEPKEGEDYTVSQDGVSITLKTKSYVVTPEDTKKLGKAVSDKGNSDKALKEFFTACGVSDDDYKSLWDNFENVDENTETAYFDVYYDTEENPCGIAIKDDEKTVANYVVFAHNDTDVIIDCDMGSEGTENTMKGHFKYENETLNGKLTAKTKSQEEGENLVTFEYKDMIVTEDKMIGDAVVNGDVNGQKMELVYSFNINGDNGTMDIKATSNGEDMGSFKMDMQTTDASDITVPTGTTYKMTDEEELQKYTESCDVEGWQENVKKALGEELYNEVFGAQQVEAADGEAVVVEEEAEPEAKTEKKTEKKAEKKSA
ncbi:MAG: hypothetical protein K6B74_08330 [Ruminococcus sp.]|nr:hypothetical protein [Ruminococcus sp.]